jgi:hypothetical protein
MVSWFHKEPSMDIILIVIAFILAGWMVAPPRAEERTWLAAGVGVIWGALILVGLWRGVLAGYELWLILLALMAAVAGLLVVWSAVNLRSSKGD